MLPTRVRSEQDRIDSLRVLLAPMVDEVDPRIQNVYANHIVLAAAGFVENAVFSILAMYSERNGDARVRRYVERTIRHHNSLNAEKIRLLLEHFDRDWWECVNKRTTAEAIASVDSLKTLRDQIAHGKPNGTGFTVVSGYYAGAKRFVVDLSDVVIP